MRAVVLCLVAQIATAGSAFADDRPISKSVARQARALAAQPEPSTPRSVIAEDCRRAERVGAAIGGTAGAVLGLRVASDVPGRRLSTFLTFMAIAAALGAERGARFGAALADGCDR